MTLDQPLKPAELAFDASHDCIKGSEFLILLDDPRGRDQIAKNHFIADMEMEKVFRLVNE